MKADRVAAKADSLEQYREYLHLLASQQIAARFRGKVDPSGIVQDTLFEAHQEIAAGLKIPAGERLAWLRRILANNLADEVRRVTADKRDVGREVSLQQATEQSSQRLEQWLARDLAPDGPAEHEEQVLQLAAASVLDQFKPAVAEELGQQSISRNRTRIRRRSHIRARNRNLFRALS